MKNYDRLDNYYLDDLIDSIDLNSTLSRYYPLIEFKEQLKKTLKENNIIRKEEYNSEKLKDLFREDIIRLFSFAIHLYDFKPRKLKELDFIDPIIIDELNSIKINNSGDFILYYLSNKDKKYQYFYDICNLMRLPGVKGIRAKLYYDCGFKSFDDFVCKKAEDIQKIISDFINENERKESCPLPKEISTHIAVAKIIKGINDENN